jgi:hypothetical protein
MNISEGGGLHVSIAANDEDAQALKSTAAAAFLVVKGKVSDFVQHSKFVVDVLDDLSKAHPIIAGASSMSCLNPWISMHLFQSLSWHSKSH